MRKLLSAFFGLVLTLICFIQPTPVLAEGEFTTNYDITYEVGVDGITNVVENITLVNTTDKFYASSYSFSISSTEMFDISAVDPNGPLETKISTESNRTVISVQFNEQVVGKDKQYNWQLRYKSRDFAQSQGKVWQITIPRAPKLNLGDKFNLSLVVPVSFGDPTTIVPEPSKTSESNGQLRMRYTKDQVQESGILANFGSEQIFDYQLVYNLDNPNILPAIAKLPLPPDTNYQSVIINQIEPKPDNVTVDDDGNYLAWFKVPRQSKLDVSIKGLAKLTLNSSKTAEKLSDEKIKTYTKSDQYWDTNNPIMKTTLDEILKDQSSATNQQKAQLINKYVVNLLKYNDARVEKEDFQRLGALTALNNPDQSLCNEYTDLFVTLARAAGIPARRLEGYAYTANTQIRPLSLGTTLLHAWPEYYDDQRGWVMIDPTWESSNDGVNYFNRFDLNHFVLSVMGTSSTEPSTGGQVNVSFAEGKFEPTKQVEISLDAPAEVLSGIPAKAYVELVNTGSIAQPINSLGIKSIDQMLLKETSLVTPIIPPFGKVKYEFNLNTRNFWQPFNDQLEINFAESVVQKQLQVKPFYHYPGFLWAAIGTVTGMVALYIVTIGLHWYTSRRALK